MRKGAFHDEAKGGCQKDQNKDQSLQDRPRQEKDQERPEEIKLLLDRQRPKMREGVAWRGWSDALEKIGPIENMPGPKLTDRSYIQQSGNANYPVKKWKNAKTSTRIK